MYTVKTGFLYIFELIVLRIGQNSYLKYIIFLLNNKTNCVQVGASFEKTLNIKNHKNITSKIEIEYYYDIIC